MASCSLRMRARYRAFMGLPPLPREGQDRWVLPNSSEGEMFVSNEVITSRYTWYSFLPDFLFAQFRRFANFYFLIVCILQTIPSVSTTNGIPITFLPLGIVLAFDGLVTAREDYKRHQDDAKANSSPTLALRDGAFTTLPWKAVRVGDILKIRRGETVPADCVFLASFTTDADSPDTCYVQTAQLDGETNLKLRKAAARTAAHFTSDEAAAAFHGAVRCEGPNASFDHFVGMLWMQRPAGSSSSVSPAPHALAATVAAAEEEEAPISLEAEQLLLRGSVIRNVDHVYALVVYTGRETKVRVKQTSRALKRARVEREINRLGAVLVVILIAFCITGVIGTVVWTAERNFQVPARGPRPSGKQPPPWYLLARRTTFVEGLQRLCTYFLLNAGFIPISLYTTVRLARTLQMMFMQKDAGMVHEETVNPGAGLSPPPAPAEVGEGGQTPVPPPPPPPSVTLSFPCKVRTMDLADELGQITHVFSDKTGTLTQNYMAFRKLSIGGVSYGIGSTRMGAPPADRAGSASSPSPFPSLPHVDYQDGSLSHPGRTLAADSADPRDGSQGTNIALMLVHLALNHTVLPETVRDPANPAIILGTRLSASSPDEEAFLYAAETFGLKFATRVHDLVTLRCRHAWARTPFAAPEDAAAPGANAPGGCDLPFRVLHILSYSQERKRMSVIVEAPVWDAAAGRPVQGSGRGALYLFCKGADSVILPRLTPAAADSSDAEMRRATRRYLADWGTDGLRTLVFAYKPLTRAAFETWSADFVRACTDIEQVRRRKAKQPNAIEELMSDIESGLLLQGATANEDQLQPGVPETIAQLGRAGIKIWMVTGDKQETATTIGFACKLLDDTMRQVVATVDSAGDVRAAVKRIRVAAKRMRLEKEEDSRAAASTRTQMENLMDWFSRGLEVLESRMGFAPAGAGKDAAAVIPFPAAAPGAAPPVTPRLGSKPAPSLLPTPPVAPLLGEAASPPVLNLRGPHASPDGAVSGGNASSSSLAPPPSSSSTGAETTNPAASSDSTPSGKGVTAPRDSAAVPEPVSAGELPRRSRTGTLLRLLMTGSSSGSGEEASSEGSGAGTGAFAPPSPSAEAPPTPANGGGASAVSRLVSRASRALSFSAQGKGDVVDAAAAAASDGGRYRGASFESEDGELMAAVAMFEEEAASAAVAGDEGGEESAASSSSSGSGEGSSGSHDDGGHGPDRRKGHTQLTHGGSAFTGLAAGAEEAEALALPEHVTGSAAAPAAHSFAAGALPHGAHPTFPPARPLVASSSGEASDEAVIAKLTAPLVGARRRPFALIIDEAVLDAALEHPKTRAYLLYVAVNCTSVICCRARPDQKAQVVRLIKEGIKHSCTLAIGDGANDVAMIQQAAVGVGIAGVEGVQAANASDYAIGRFRFLQRLLLVHGRWNYSRMCRLVLYTFYKNVLFVCTQYWYSVENGFSGQKFFIEYGSQLYNLVFTSLPILILAVLDVDLPAETVLRYPALYEHGRRGRGLNVRIFLSWMLAAIVESLAIYFVTSAAMPVPDGDDGAMPYIFSLGLVCFTVVLAVVSLRIMIEMHSHYWFFQFFTAGCAIIWIPFCFLDDVLNGDGMRGLVRHVFDSAAVWFTMALLIAGCALRAAAWRAWRRFYKPSFTDIVREAHALAMDFATVDVYAAALDLSRRTGKSVQEVLEAASITQAAAAAVAARRAATAAAKASADTVGATLLRPLSWIGAGMGRAFAFQTGAASPRVRRPGSATKAGPGAAEALLPLAPAATAPVPTVLAADKTDPGSALPPVLRDALAAAVAPAAGMTLPPPPSARSDSSAGPTTVLSPLQQEGMAEAALGLRPVSPLDGGALLAPPPAATGVSAPPSRSPAASPSAAGSSAAPAAPQSAQRKRWWRRGSTSDGFHASRAASFFEAPGGPDGAPSASKPRGRRGATPSSSPPASAVTVQSWTGDEPAATGPVALPQGGGAAGAAVTPGGPLLPLTAPAPSSAATPRWHRGSSLADLTPVMLDGSSVLERALLPGRRRFDSEAVIPTLAYDASDDFDHEMPAEAQDTWVPKERSSTARRLRNRGSCSALAEELEAIDAEGGGDGSSGGGAGGPTGPFAVVLMPSSSPVPPALAGDSFGEKVPTAALGAFIGAAGGSDAPLLGGPAAGPSGGGSVRVSPRSSPHASGGAAYPFSPSPQSASSRAATGWRSASVEPPFASQTFLAASSGPAVAGSRRGSTGPEAPAGPSGSTTAPVRRAHSAGAVGGGAARHRRPAYASATHIGGPASLVGGDFTVDPAAAEFIAARFTTYGPQTHALSKWYADASPPPAAVGGARGAGGSMGSATSTVVPVRLHPQPLRPAASATAATAPPPPARPVPQPAPKQP